MIPRYHLSCDKQKRHSRMKETGVKKEEWHARMHVSLFLANAIIFVRMETMKLAVHVENA